ncbi:NrtA/SsuA/CpmA family ABC transporter substrate-binding protein [Dethiosulfovibrio sp. F2B]|uniref:ABC transporter substrate-binding protein n=1 Tax=Dethiosulfovibrio faecalis TaxID=2720018 RepID=UPI001F15BB83|nr:NrtA/SsuA/CpmA family ABC transporter substrate-binding protein [Dethiosulfovibrio faecalis]MCF4151043.1 NrtA/SsuA/CpmA family ABC transporter substrate-binding protein [Dethiosulfovibrio faecalis]
MKKLSFLMLLCLCFATTVSAEEAVKVGTWKTAQTIQPFFYGDYASEDVEVLSFTNPADQKTALLAGSLGMCGTTIAHAIHSASMGQPVVLVASLCNRCSALVVGKDGPIEEISQLRGKRIGYVPGTMHEILLREALTRNGLSPEKDVSLVRIDFFDMGTALARGSIDAFLSGEPFPTLAVADGYGRVLSYPYYDDSVGTINAGMLVTERLIEEDPDMVMDLVRAHVRATEFLRSNPDVWLKKAVSFGTEKEILEKASANIELAWDMDDAFVERVKALGARMEELHVIDRQPDYERLFDLSFVRRVKEEMGF